VKKILITLTAVVMLSGAAMANDIKDLNDKLLDIEARIDKCLDTKDKAVCGDFMIENPMLSEVLGNEDFAKLLMTSKCQVGTKCYSTNARLLTKTLQASLIITQ
jgi:hypothetical protein